MDSDDYLQADFDPTSITVPRLRSILVTHNVPYQATAKKPQLVALFNDHVAPRAERILAERARLRRTSRGIVDAHTANDVDDDDQDDAHAPSFGLPPPQAPRAARRSASPRKGIRRSVSPRKQSAPVRVKHEEEEELDIEPTPLPRRPTRSASRNMASESEDDHGRAARRVTRRSVTPMIKAEQEDDLPIRSPIPGPVRDNASPFSSDNPFQAGSSPADPPRRRRTGGADVVQSRPTPSGIRRSAVEPPISTMFGTPRPAPVPAFANTPKLAAPRTGEFRVPDTYRDDTATPRHRYDDSTPKSRTVSRSTQSFQVPAHHLIRRPQPPPSPRPASPEPEPDDGLEPGEEFTPDEQLQLAQEMENDRQLAQLRERPKDKRQGRSTLGTAVFALFVVLVGAYLSWYRQEKVAAGYCGLGTRSGSRLIAEDWPVPDWAVPFIEPTCQNCPSHAICYENLVARCESDFVLRPHPLSLGGLVPLAPTCEPDGARARKIKAVADKAVEELRERRARWECNDLYDDSGKRETSPRIEVNRLKNSVASKRSKKINADEFEDLWAAALGEVKARDEVEQTVDPGSDPSDFPDTHLVSSSLARIPFVCAVKRSIRLSLARHRLPIGSLICMVALFFFGRARYRRHAAITAQVPGLVNLVLSRLAAQRDLGDEGIDDGFLFQPQLRDDILREVHSLREREVIWSKVRAFVEQNSNVRIVQRESRHGEIGRAWEWIGPSVEAMSVHRRRSGRASYGPDPVVEIKEEVSERGGHEEMTSRWQEGQRPYF